MRTRRRKIIAAAAALLLLLALCWLLIPSGPPDPTFHDGKPLSYWLKQPGPIVLIDKNTGDRFGPAAQWLTRANTNAIPRLVAAIRNDNGLHKYYEPCWARLPKWVQQRIP